MLTCFVAGAQTPFSHSGRLPWGAPNTNQCVITAWPPGQPFYIYGTNIVFGSYPQTNNPDANGFFTNQLYAGTYSVVYPAFPQFGFFVQIPDTTNQLPLAYYATNTPVTSATYGSMYGVVTNWLGFKPATNGAALSYSLLPWTPPTNTFPGLTYVLGYTPATNSNAGIVAALGYTPATNGFAAFTNALGYVPMTNSYAAVTNALGFNAATNGGQIAVSQLPYTPATNNTPLTTTSNPTNSFIVGVLYTNSASKSDLIGFASGGILYYTNNGTGYWMPVTNNFAVRLATNATFTVTGGYLTNVVNWK